MRLISYKMTDDTGFAPNPFKGFLTLANCKPKMRKYRAQCGDWIAGFTSVTLNKDLVGHEKLLFLMRVSEKIKYVEYWSNNKYACKKPKLDSNNFEDKAGDNIYRINKKSALGFERIPETIHHEREKEQQSDLAGEYVLISDHFYYFGSKPIDISNCNNKPNIQHGVCPYGLITENAQNFISFIEKEAEKRIPIQPGIYAYPHKWEDEDKKSVSKKSSINKTSKRHSSCG